MIANANEICTFTFKGMRMTMETEPYQEEKPFYWLDYEMTFDWSKYVSIVGATAHAYIFFPFLANFKAFERHIYSIGGTGLESTPPPENSYGYLYGSWTGRHSPQNEGLKLDVFNVLTRITVDWPLFFGSTIQNKIVGEYSKSGNIYTVNISIPYIKCFTLDVFSGFAGNYNSAFLTIDQKEEYPEMNLQLCCFITNVNSNTIYEDDFLELTTQYYNSREDALNDNVAYLYQAENPDDGSFIQSHLTMIMQEYGNGIIFSPNIPCKEFTYRNVNIWDLMDLNTEPSNYFFNMMSVSGENGLPYSYYTFSNPNLTITYNVPGAKLYNSAVGAFDNSDTQYLEATLFSGVVVKINYSDSPEQVPKVPDNWAGTQDNPKHLNPNEVLTWEFVEHVYKASDDNTQNCMFARYHFKMDMEKVRTQGNVGYGNRVVICVGSWIKVHEFGCMAFAVPGWIPIPERDKWMYLMAFDSTGHANYDNSAWYIGNSNAAYIVYYSGWESQGAFTFPNSGNFMNAVYDEETGIMDFDIDVAVICPFYVNNTSNVWGNRTPVVTPIEQVQCLNIYINPPFNNNQYTTDSSYIEDYDLQPYTKQRDVLEGEDLQDTLWLNSYDGINEQSFLETANLHISFDERNQHFSWWSDIIGEMYTVRNMTFSGLEGTTDTIRNKSHTLFKSGNDLNRDGIKQFIYDIYGDALTDEMKDYTGNCPIDKQITQCGNVNNYEILEQRFISQLWYDLEPDTYVVLEAFTRIKAIKTIKDVINLSILGLMTGYGSTWR